MQGYDNPPTKNLSQAEYDALFQEIKRGIITLGKTKPHCQKLYSSLYDQRTFITANPSFIRIDSHAQMIPADMHEASRVLKLFLSENPPKEAIDRVSQLLNKADEEVKISQNIWERANKPPRGAKFDAPNSADATEYFRARREKYQTLFALNELRAHKKANEPANNFNRTFTAMLQSSEKVVSQISTHEDVQQYLSLLVADIQHANPKNARDMSVDHTPLRARAILSGIQLTGCANLEYLEELVLYDLAKLREEMSRLNRDPQTAKTDVARTAQKLRITTVAAKALGLEK